MVVIAVEKSGAHSDVQITALLMIGRVLQITARETDHRTQVRLRVEQVRKVRVQVEMLAHERGLIGNGRRYRAPQIAAHTGTVGGIEVVVAQVRLQLQPPTIKTDVRDRHDLVEIRAHRVRERKTG